MSVCDFCGKSYHLNSMKRHVVTEHSTKELHRCSWCDKYFTQEDNLKEHMRTHTQEWLQCGACIFITKQSSEMTRHKQAHHGHPKRGKVGVKVDHSHVNLTQADVAAIRKKITPESRQLTRRMRSSQNASSTWAPRADSFDVKPFEPQPSWSGKINREPFSRSRPYNCPIPEVEAVQESVVITPPEQASVFVWNTSPSEPSATGLSTYPYQPSSSSSSTNLWDYPYAHGLWHGEVQESAVPTPHEETSAFPWSLPPPSSTERFLPGYPNQPSSSSWPPTIPLHYLCASGWVDDEVESALLRLPEQTSALAQNSMSSSPPSATPSEYSCICPRLGRHEVGIGCTYCASLHVPITSAALNYQPLHGQSDTGINYDTDLDSGTQLPDFSGYTVSL